MAEVIRGVAPDVVLLLGLDVDYGGHAVRALADLIGPGLYPHHYAPPGNRGLWRDDDGDGDNRLGEPEDAEGYGLFPGNGGAAILSRYPVAEVENLSSALWSAMPDSLHGDDIRGGQRLSTTMHWDVSVALPGGDALSLWAWHATAPVFDGPADENGRRNHDEAAVWVRRLERRPEAEPVVLGVSNLDPADGDGRAEAMAALLSHPRLQDPRPESMGGRAVADAGHLGDPSLDTATFPTGPGNLRVDYILPSRAWRVVDSGVVWPTGGALAETVVAASRHRLVWVDVDR